MSTSVFNSPVFNQVPFNGGASASAPVTGACVSLAIAQVNTCTVSVALADCGEVMAEYTIGNLIRVSAAFTNSGGSAVDPGGVIVRACDPLGTITVYTYGVDAALIKDAVGQYHLDIEVLKEGIWFWRVEGKTSNKGAGESSFTVTDSKFYNTSGGLVG